MARIEKAKTYTGKDLETIFFRPMLTGPGAEELGIRVLYNTPTPTTLHFWRRSGDILQKYSGGGWSGAGGADKFQKTIDLHKVKAEMGYSAEDYFSLVFQQIAARPDINMEDLSGTELEEAETALFRESVTESIRATMWIGDVTRDESVGYNTFNGILPKLMAESVPGGGKEFLYSVSYLVGDYVVTVLDTVWDQARQVLKDSKGSGNLAWYVTSDVYTAYEKHLNEANQESAYLAKQSGRDSLFYMGIPLVDVKLGQYLPLVESELPHSFAILTDRRNLALAVNTSDFPGTEVRMWYNPDEMENRQRAIFMAGADYLLPEMICMGIGYNG